jgi:hypothetical protein
LELGRFLVSEALGTRSNDTLSRWLLHAIAERITLAEEETEASQRQRRENEAAELILGLWKHRAVAPIGIDPLARYERIFKSLEILLPEANPWRTRETAKTERIAAELYRCLISLSVGIFLLSVENIKERSSIERELLDRFLPTDQKAMLALFEQFDEHVSSAIKEVPAEELGQVPSHSPIAMLPVVRVWMSRTSQAIEALSEALDNVEAATSKSGEETREMQEAIIAPFPKRDTAKKHPARRTRKKRAHSDAGTRRKSKR